MVYGIGINGNNNYWIPDSTFVGGNSMPTSLWSYDFSTMSPQDSLGTWNDSGLFNFDWATNNLVNQVAMFNAKWMPILNKYMSNMSAWYQNSMMNISSGTNTNINMGQFPPVNNANNNNGVNNNGNNNSSYADKIEESDVSSFIGKLGADPKWQSAFGDKIKLEDGTEVTMLQRLMDLINDYMTNDNPELSEEEFNKIREIAGKYAKTGKIDRDDFITLKKIIESHTGKIGKTESEEKSDKKTESNAATRPNQNIIERSQSAYGYKKTAHLYFEAMDGAGTNKEELASASRSTTKYNVVEIMQTYEEENALNGDGLTLPEKIFDDCDNWGTGSSWYGDDDAKPYIKAIKESLIARTNDFINAGYCNEETAKELKAAAKSLDTAYNSVKDDDLSDTNKNDISQAINNLFSMLHNAEIGAYKKFDEEANITDDQVI